MRVVNYLYRRMNRELSKIKYRAVGSGVLIIISVAIYIGFSAMIPIAGDALEDKVDDLNLSDYLVHVNSANESMVPGVRAIGGVDQVEPRIQLASRIGYTEGGKDRDVSAFLYGIDPAQNPSINKIEIFGDDSRYFSGNGSGTILLERGFAGTVGLEVGDTVTINTASGVARLDVIGLVMTAEYLFLPINPQSLMPQPGNLAVAYVPIDWLRASFMLPDDFVNEFSINFLDGWDDQKVEEAVNDHLAHNIILFSVPKDEVYGYSLIKEDLEQGEGFIGLFAFMLLAIAFFIVYTSFARIVQEQKREIGILRALGYSRGKVLGSYLYMAFLIGMVASVLGLVFGIPTGQALGSFYVEMMLGTPLSGFAMVIDAYIVGLIFGPATAMLACLIAVWGTVTMEPQDAIRGVPRTFLKRSKKAGSTKKRVGKAPRGSYIAHYTYKNMGRHGVRTAVTIMAIGGAVMLGAMSLVMMGSFQNSIDKSIEDYEKWDVIAEFSYPLNGSTADNLTSPHITQREYLSRIGAEWQEGSKDGLTLVVGLDQEQSLHRFNVQEGRLATNDGEAMVNKFFARDEGIKRGDSVTLNTFTGSSTVTIVGIVQDSLGMFYVDIALIETLAGETVYSGMYLKTTPDSVRQVKESLIDSPLITEVQTKGGAKGALMEYMESFGDLLYIMTLLGVAVAAPTLANIVFVGVLERYPEYGQLRAIGYSRGQIAKSILLELMIIVTAGSIIGAPFTYLFIKGYEGAFQEFYPTYQTILYPADWMGFFVTVAIIYIIAILAAAPSIRTVNRMDVAKVVSGERFG